MLHFITLCKSNLLLKNEPVKYSCATKTFCLAGSLATLSSPLASQLALYCTGKCLSHYLQNTYKTPVAAAVFLRNMHTHRNTLTARLALNLLKQVRCIVLQPCVFELKFSVEIYMSKLSFTQPPRSR